MSNALSSFALLRGAYATCAILAALAGPGAAFQIAFEAKLGLPTPPDPRACARADVDGDGDADLIAATQDGISVYENLGGMRFDLRLDTSAAAGHTDIATGDLNGDGDVDVVTVSNGTPTALNVFDNNGTGIFTHVLGYPLSANPTAVVLGDFDLDLDLDVAIADSVPFSSGPSRIGVMTNQSLGVLSPPSWHSSGGMLRALVTVDLDGDGDLDFAATGTNMFGGSLLSIHRNDGTGAFDPPTSTFLVPNMVKLAASDIDSDGDADLVAVDTSTVFVFQNLGVGNFFAPVGWSAGALISGSTEIVDFDGDLARDVLVPTQAGIALLRNSGGSSLAAPSIVSKASASTLDLAAADLDQDGDVDMASIDNLAEAIVAHENVGGAFFEFPVVPGTGNGRAAVADLDGDLDLDAVVIGPGNAFSVLRNVGAGQMQLAGTFATTTAGEAVVGGDIDADGDIDVVVATGASSTTSVFSNDGTANFGPAVTYPAPAGLNRVALGDLDQDGDLDLCVAETSAALRVRMNDGAGAFGAPTSYATPPQLSDLRLSDLDGDLDLDVVTTHELGNVVAVYSNSGGVLAAHTTVPLVGQLTGVATADFDGDLDVDLAVTVFDTRSVRLLWNNGSANFTQGPSVPVGRLPRSIAAADLDLDGRMDFVTCDLGGASTTLVHNAGGGTFDGQTRITGAGLFDLALGDLDGDGDADLVVPGATPSGTAIVRNAFVSGTPYCSGDGSASTCPCGNSSSVGAGAGCRNSLGLDATLRGSGAASLTSDRLVLRGQGLAAVTPGLFFQGTQAFAGGAGASFGDGLFCAGGSILRLGVEFAVSGTVQYPGALAPRVSAQGLVTAPGEKFYQLWYRDAATFCTSDTFNLTNGWRVLWQP